MKGIDQETKLETHLSSWEQVWAIRASVKILSNDGNLLDAACMATATALLHFRRPDVSVVDDEVVVVSSPIFSSLASQ